MDNQGQQLRNIYALMHLCQPELINAQKLSNSDKVAMKLICSTAIHHASVHIITVDEKEYHYELDVEGKIYQSKGNWLWIRNIDINFPEDYLLSIQINPRVIDLPYSHKKICAYWLFRNIQQEFKQTMNHYL